MQRVLYSVNDQPQTDTNSWFIVSETINLSCAPHIKGGTNLTCVGAALSKNRKISGGLKIDLKSDDQSYQEFLLKIDNNAIVSQRMDQKRCEQD